MARKPVVGVLMMAYGSPEKTEDILPYYTDIRRGRAPTPEQLAELVARYAAIGGVSELTEISRRQVAGVAAMLKAAASPVEYRVYFANRHWEPRIPDVVRQMAKDGIERAVALVLAPQGSKMSSGAYFEIIDQALAAMPDYIAFKTVWSWHLAPEFIAGLTAKTAEALTRFPENVRGSLPVIFTCHSLPEKIVTWRDPYPDQLRDMGAALAANLGLTNVHYAYQSAGRTPEPWLGPDVRVKLRELAAAGARDVLVCSVGFVADHLEVRYDLDIELKREAEGLGVHLERMGMLNDHPLLLQALVNVIRLHAQGE